MGVTLKNLFYLGSLGICLAILIVAMIIFFFYGIIKYHRNGLSKKDGAKYGLNISFYIFWMGSTLFVMMASGFKIMHWAIAWILTTIILSSGFINIIKKTPVYKNDKYKGCYEPYLRSLKAGLLKFGWRNSLFVFLTFLVVSFIATFFIYDLCIGIHPFRVSSRYSRMHKGDNCKSGEICNFILTVPQDLSSSIIANFHSQDEPIYSFSLYGKSSNSDYNGDNILLDNPYGSISNATSFKMKNIEKEINRWVSWADIEGLTPSTTYYIVVGIQLANGKIITYPERKFRTAPNDNTPYNFVAGGDMGLTKGGKSLSISAAEQEPLFVMIGGDVAYDSGFVSCYKCWDEWFTLWDTNFITPSNYSLPILTTIGNHEAAGWRSNKDTVQFYIRYLPFQLGLSTMDPNDRPLQHYHTIGNETIIVVVDSWVVDSIESQVEYLENTLQQYNTMTFKFALYHIALYPCTSISADKLISDTAKQYWGPVFDKYSLTVGLENHYHLYKRSKQLVNGKENPNGTLYIGDGAFGVLNILKPEMFDYLDYSGSIMHIIHTKVNTLNNSIQIETINTSNEIFDKWNRTL